MNAFRLIASIVVISVLFSDTGFLQESKEKLAKAAPKIPLPTFRLALTRI